MKFVAPCIVAILAACAATTPAADPTIGESGQASGQAFEFDPFDPPLNRSLALGNAESAILARFGKPRAVNSKTGPDRRDPTTTVTVTDYDYDGLRFQTMSIVGSDESWLERIEVTQTDIGLRRDLDIGIKRSELLSTLQPKQMREVDNTVRITTDHSDSVTIDSNIVSIHTNIILVIEFDDNDRATRMSWEFYGD